MERDIEQFGRLLSFVNNPSFSKLIPTQLMGEENYSQLYQFKISGYCKDINFRLSNLLHQAVAIKLTDGKDTRYFHGYVSQIDSLEMTGHKLRRFNLSLRPQLWFLNYSGEGRIFHSMTLPDVVKSILKTQGISQVDFSCLKHHYPAKNYCTQYNETDLSFILRLLEEACIEYYFSHTKSSHTLHCIDNPGLLPTYEKPLIHNTSKADEPHIYSWSRRCQLVPTSANVNNFHYEFPEENLFASLQNKTSIVANMKNPLIWSQYPTDQPTQGQAQRNASLLLQRLQGKQVLINGRSNVIELSGGLKFQLKKHAYNTNENGQYLIISISHKAEDFSHINTSNKEENTSTVYENQFQAIPSLQRYSSSQQYKKPRIKGYHNAVVVDQNNDANVNNKVHSDKLGRIKVKFPWLSDENSNTCWIRVMQQGNNYFLPRVGQEVLIAYLDDDIDKPICIGLHHNATNSSTYTLPEKQHLSGIKTRTVGSTDKHDCHELRFNDLFGSEAIDIIANNQFKEVIKGSSYTEVKNHANFKIHGKHEVSSLKDVQLKSPVKITMASNGGTLIIKPKSIEIEASLVKIGDEAD